jgi:O-acetyl-ADP-ribose deacetylase (regulator of RNase III)
MGIGHSFSKEYAGRKFCVGVRDLLGAPTDTIVNPANSGLSHGGGVAEQIAQFAGEAFLRDSRRVVGEYGRVPLTQAVITVAGNLPFKGIINAVGPRMTEPNVAEKLEQTITNCLSLADAQGWHSIGFPALSTGIYGVPKKIRAKAFAKVIPDYWASHPESALKLVWLCLFERDYAEFKSWMTEV